MQESLAIAGAVGLDGRCPFAMTQLVNVISHHGKRSLLKSDKVTANHIFKVWTG